MSILGEPPCLPIKCYQQPSAFLASNSFSTSSGSWCRKSSQICRSTSSTEARNLANCFLSLLPTPCRMMKAGAPAPPLSLPKIPSAWQRFLPPTSDTATTLYPHAPVYAKKTGHNVAAGPALSGAENPVDGGAREAGRAGHRGDLDALGLGLAHVGDMLGLDLVCPTLPRAARLSALAERHGETVLAAAEAAETAESDAERAVFLPKVAAGAGRLDVSAITTSTKGKGGWWRKTTSIQMPGDTVEKLDHGACCTNRSKGIET